jgi:hypothetical protein
MAGRLGLTRFDGLVEKMRTRRLIDGKPRISLVPTALKRKHVGKEDHHSQFMKNTEPFGKSLTDHFISRVTPIFDSSVAPLV